MRGRATGGGPGVRRLAGVVGCAALLLATSGCDNIVKRFDVFATMVDGPATETYEERPGTPPEGTMPVAGRPPSFDLPAADTASALQNPLSGTEAELERGRQVYVSYCLPCHGPEGRGRGPVVNYDTEDEATNARLPFIPAVDLTSGTGPERSDGYVWGIIHNGRGLMPDYRRVGSEDRWHVIEYVRELQRRAGAEPVRGVAGPEASGDER